MLDIIWPLFFHLRSIDLQSNDRENPLILCCVPQMIREAISNHTGNALPEEPPAPPARAFGPVHLAERAALMESLLVLAPGDGIPAFKPAPMEAYGQPYAPFPLSLLMS